MALNMDRALLWCVAVEGVWSHPRSWDTKDRFETVEALSRTHGEIAARSIGKGGASIARFNPSSWKRSALIELALPAGKTPKDAPAQLLEDGKTALVRAELPPMAMWSLALADGAVAASRPAPLPDTIETDFYAARIDPRTAALLSLKLKPSGREILGGPANVIAADERNEKDVKQVFAHEVPRKPDRVAILSSSDKPSAVKYSSGPLASIVEAVCAFRGGKIRRVVRFHRSSPRIDFVTETNGLPHGTIVTAAFPLAGEITEIRRAIPYGFAHCAWSRPNPDLSGLHHGILPVIRWSHYSLAGGGGAALLDKGVPAREVVDNTAYVILHNATHVYYWDNAAKWMSGEGTQRFEYALVAHDTDWPAARIPHMAWEYNAAPLLFPEMEAPPAGSCVDTSENLIVEALRRTGGEIEIRAVECFGVTAEARIRIDLPHTEAALTNLMGEERRTLSPASKSDTGFEYRFEVRPQQIVTLRLKTGGAVAPVKALRTFDPVVPEHKRAATRGFDHPELKGHPPRDGEPEWKKFDV
jgi:alpha-mannosidase